MKENKFLKAIFNMVRRCKKENLSSKTIECQSLDIAETLNCFETCLDNGLTEKEVCRRKKIYPPNKIYVGRNKNILIRFFRQFNNSLVYILVITAIVTFYLGEFVDTSVILGVVVVNAIFSFIQEGKAHRALNSIRTMLSMSAVVIRGAKRETVHAEDLVPGDIVIINRGDKIPADLRICEAVNLQVDESILTGESIPVEKQIAPVADTVVIGEAFSIAYSGTLVTSGRGLGVVIGTGIDTAVGRISVDIANAKSMNTPLFRQLNLFGCWLALYIVIFAVMVLLVGYFFWNNVTNDIFMSVVGLIVAAIPEGLPPIVTIILAIGVTRMSKKNAIVRNLHAVETMGSVTTICTDKTGTLTKNELKVLSVVTSKENYHFDNEELHISKSCDLDKVITSGLLCSNVYLDRGEVICRTQGNPVDVALVFFGKKLGVDRDLLKKKFPRLDLIPYETEHKFMASLHCDHRENRFIIVKGAPEIILKKCQYQLDDGKERAIDNHYWIENLNKLTSTGQRVIAVATNKFGNFNQKLNINDIGSDMIFVGLFGLLDPPREDAIFAVSRCATAGIKVKMITGDHALTARKISGAIGIKNEEVLTGDIIDEMGDDELESKILEIDIYARMSPHHKLRLVRALQQQGEIVAMTGDGINDAPALKQADIGIAMGLKGSDLAKESSDMVLADDNFATIVSAVSEGRTIFDNIKKSIFFVLPVSFAQAFAIVVAVLFGMTQPITPVQILWVNMITAASLALALGFEPANYDVMKGCPNDVKNSLLSGYLLWRSFFVSLTIVVAVFCLFFLAYFRSQDIFLSRTVAVNTLVVCEIFYLINCRNFRVSSFNFKTMFTGKFILVAIVVVILLQLAFTYFAIMQHFFKVTSLQLYHWVIIFIVGFVFFGFVELEKKCIRYWE